MIIRASIQIEEIDVRLRWLGGERKGIERENYREGILKGNLINFPQSP